MDDIVHGEDLSGLLGSIILAMAPEGEIRPEQKSCHYKCERMLKDVNLLFVFIFNVLNSYTAFYATDGEALAGREAGNHSGLPL